MLALGTGVRTIQNTLYKTEPSLMFISRKRNGERQIFQDTRINLASKMKSYTATEKAGMMGLQTLVGFSRYKNNLIGTDYEIGENGEKIYCQKFSTVTHGVNLKTLKMIEDLGYIKIDAMDDKFRKNILDTIIGNEPRGLRKLLIAEKLGFRNYGDLKKIATATLKGDKTTLESMKKDFKKVTFRLTDKEINFDELYRKSANISEVKDKKEQTALRRLSVIFDNKQGIFATRNIDVGKDNFGRDVIKYNTNEPLGKRVERQKMIEKFEKMNFRDSLTKNVNTKGLEQRAMENLEQAKTKREATKTKEETRE